jgi:hypothetical protein
VAFQDLPNARPRTASDPDGGWAELMRQATTFPLERLSFGSSTPAPVVLLPKPREVSYDAVIDIADGAGLSLATW